MIVCPNKNLDSWKELVAKVGEDAAYVEWQKQSEEDVNPQPEINGLPENDSKPLKLSQKAEQRYVTARDYLAKRLARLKQELKNVDPNSPTASNLRSEIDDISSKIEIKTSNKSYSEFGKELLKNVGDSLNDLKSGKNKVTIQEVSRNREILQVFKDFPSLSRKIQKLQLDLEPFVDQVTENEVNKYSTEDKELTIEDIFNQKEDINRLRAGVGALSDVADYLGRTIGAKIKNVQNKISSENQHLADKIQKEVNLLKEYQKKQGIAGKKIYDVFIQEDAGTTVLTQKYTSEFYRLRDKAIQDVQSNDEKVRKDAENWFKENLKYDEEEGIVPTDNKFINPQYVKIQNTPDLKRFYDFHKQITYEAKNKLPVEIGENFIANVKSEISSDILNGNKTLLSGLKEGLKSLINVKSFTEGQFIGDEDLSNDILPVKYINPVAAEAKSRDLGENLLKFSTAANNYNEMSNVLPEIRLLQDQIRTKKYIKSSDPSTRINGDASNIFKMVEGYINAQVKGKNKSDEGKIKLGPTYDENGNPNGEKYILTSDIVDFGLRYNSLLRIGLNPINAVTNYLIGDIGNIVEGFGGKFYTLNNLKTATSIFFKQNFKQDSVMNKLLEDLNPLQELEDYEAIDRVRLKGKFSSEDLKNFMYKPQQMGEKFLQTRTMLAVMLKDGYLTKDGKLTEEYNKLTDLQKGKLADKIQRLNQSIHGRYSGRDAAIMQQNVLYRALIQFRKWIPAAFENRFGGKQHDNRLGTEIEGRYTTLLRLFVKDLGDTLSRIQSGKLTQLEIYNLRKNLFGATMLFGTILAYNGFKGDDDDKKWRSKPGVKFALNQLNRIAGDLQFFYSPSEYNNLLKNAAPLAKTVGDMISVAKITPYLFYDAGKAETYQSGARKGENKFWSNFISLIPASKPISETIRLWNGVDFQEPK